MVVSLGCEKLQPERLLPPGSFTIVDERNVADGQGLDLRLDGHVLAPPHVAVHAEGAPLVVKREALSGRRGVDLVGPDLRERRLGCTGEPSLQVIPSRRWRVQVRLSAEISQDSAPAGWIS